MSDTIAENKKDTFIAMFTHDLKGPINSGIFALELLLRDSKRSKLNEYQKELITDILRASKFMKNLTENALCKYKVESGKYELNKEYAPLDKIIDDCILAAKYSLYEKNQKINFNRPKENIYAHIDVIEIKRVILNLISNAIKYSNKNSMINITLKKLSNSVYFEIQDQGCGINLNELSMAFEKYVRLANEQKSAGTGLGLYITKLIIDAHRGNIYIDSKIGKGTKIFFEIPI
ncbi:HAMP domain-containing histidine kinase [bacterium]|nr:HAMP domain-containing histidine kinase [bacterium]